VLVKKFAWFALRDGTARTNRKIAINTTAITTVDPAADAMVRKIRSARPSARVFRAASVGARAARSTGVAGELRVMTSSV
jgi:hypothetical protein